MIVQLKSKYRTVKSKLHYYKKVNWIKTLYFNYKMFPFSIAKKTPVFFYGKVKFSSLEGKVVIDAPIKRGMIGFGQPYEFISRSKGTAELYLNGTLKCTGHIQFGKDYFIYIDTNGYLEMGHMASIASSGKIICKQHISFGTYARMGSESQVIDTNFHQMMHSETKEKYPMNGPIKIGAYNFISNRVSILRNTVTPSNCTIASNTLCTKDYSALGENILIGGVPAKLLKSNITRDWQGEEAMMLKYLIV